MAEHDTEERKPAKIVLREMLAQSYQDAYDAKARGEKVGWATSNFPQEICETLGIKVVFPENQAAAIAARGAGQTMCDQAEGEMGYSNDLCAYARISMAYAHHGKCPNGEQEMPLPDFMLCCNNICNTVINWYENIADELGIPMILIDMPFNDEYSPDFKRTEYIRAQFDDAIRQLEEITGKMWDEDRFNEVMDYSQKTAIAWRKAAAYCNYVPSPLNGFDLFNHMAVAVTARGTKEAAAAFDQLAEECAQMVKENKSTFRAEEKHRVLFEGIACWPHLRNTSAPLKENNINVTGTVYAAAFGILYENTTDLMRAYNRIPNNIDIEAAVTLREDACRAGKVDGAVVHINRSCKLWSGIAPEMGRRLEDHLNIPVVMFDGDQADPRNFSAGQYETRIQGLAEILESNKKRNKGDK